MSEITPKSARVGGHNPGRARAQQGRRAGGPGRPGQSVSRGQPGHSSRQEHRGHRLLANPGGQASDHVRWWVGVTAESWWVLQLLQLVAFSAPRRAGRRDWWGSLASVLVLGAGRVGRPHPGGPRRQGPSSAAGAALRPARRGRPRKDASGPGRGHEPIPAPRPGQHSQPKPQPSSTSPHNLEKGTKQMPKASTARVALYPPL